MGKRRAIGIALSSGSVGKRDKSQPYPCDPLARDGIAAHSIALERGRARRVQKIEAKWIETALQAFPADELSPILDIGSQTLAFRTKEKPYIQADLFAPLMARGISIIHSDLQEGEGIDISANLLEPDGYAAIKATAPRTIFCNNVLEHVLDPAEFASKCFSVLPPGGRLVITVPKSYPHHRDPIDT